MSESLTQLYLSNPALASAIRRQQAGMQIANEGISAAPASPWQALARVGQAALGSYMENKAQGDIKAYGDQMAQDRQNASALTQALLSGGIQAPQTSGVSPTAPQDAQPAPDAPLTDRFNNPGALKFVGQPGAVSSDNGFAIFPTRDAGIKAADDLLANYGKGGINTLSGVISKWAPPSENDTGAYIARVAKASGIDPNAPIDLSDPNIRQQILPHIFAYEGGPRSTASTPLAQALTPSSPGSGVAPQASGGNTNPVTESGRLMAAAAQMKMSPDPRVQAMGQVLEQRATQMMQVGRSETIQGPNGQIFNRNLVTGEIKPLYTSPPRIETDNRGVTRAYYADGRVVVMQDNPSGFKDENQRIMAEIGPRILDGTATPEQRQQYELAAGKRAGYELKLDPATNKLVRIATTPVPPSMPQSGATPPAANPTPGATAAQPGMSEPQTLTEGGHGQQSAAAINTDTAKADLGKVSDEQAKVLSGRNNVLGTTQGIRSTLNDVATGRLADTRLAAAQILQAAGLNPDVVKNFTGTNAAMGELLQKELFKLTTGAVRGMGAREPGSVISMFKANYPELDSTKMTIDAMTRMLDADQLYQEAELAARRDHLSKAVEGVGANKPYTGLTGYKPPDPRVYQASALAAGGMPYNVWTHGLSPDQIKSALTLASTSWSDASAFNKQGVRIPLQKQAAPTP